MPETPDDLELIKRFKRSGALDLLVELYQPYMPLVYGLCLKYLKDREESKDAVMQIFEKLSESLKKHEVQHFKSWLYVSSKNYCLMLLRKKKSILKAHQNIAADDMENELLMHHDDDNSLELDVDKLKRCIETLVDEQKHCVQLFFLQEQCYKEIAENTGFDLKKVKSYIQNGKRNLKICMERKDG